MKKKIGIVGRPVHVDKTYIHFFEKWGVVESISPLCEEVKDIDLLVLPGGPDVDTKRQGIQPSVYTGKPDVFFEYFDLMMFQKYIDAGIPIFLICRGMQTAWVHFGGTMVQHVPLPISDPRGELIEEMQITSNPFFELDGSNQFQKINSIHHQIIDVNSDSEMIPFAHSTSYLENVEAIYHPKYPIAGVQYHPEELHNDYLSKMIIENFLKQKKRNYVGDRQVTESR